MKTREENAQYAQWKWCALYAAADMLDAMNFWCLQETASGVEK
jgi:hypothetical protein